MQFSKVLFITIFVLSCTSYTSKSPLAETNRVWKSEKAKFMDDIRLSNKLFELNNGFPGAGQDAEPKQVAEDIVQLLFLEEKDDKGVHLETALTALGALAGFSAQMAMREAVIKTGKSTEKQLFTILETKNGDKYYYGDILNEVVLEPRPGNLSIWSLVGGTGRQLGATNMIDMKELAGYVASTVGSNKFGVQRLPNKHKPRKLPIELLNKYWNPVRNYLALNSKSPLSWPFTLGLAAQNLILKGKDVMDPKLTVRIVMEAVVPMSKVAPEKVLFAYFEKR